MSPSVKVISCLPASASGKMPSGMPPPSISEPARPAGPPPGPGGRSSPALTCSRRPPAELGDAGGDEPPVVLLHQHQLVGLPEHLRRVGGPVRDDPDPVPGGRGDRRGVLALAADVADRHAPAVRGAEHVVEVPADVQPVGGGHVSGGDLDPGHVGQLPGQQAGLQRIGDLGPPPEHPVHPDRQRELLAQFLDQAQVGDLEVPLAGLPGQGQHAVALLPVRQRHAQQGRRAQLHQQRDPVRPGAQDRDVLSVREQHRAARLVHLARRRPGLRVHRPDHPRELLRLPVGGPHHDLPPKPLPAVDIDDDPGRQLPGQQPRAPLQRHRLAERGVLQQQPGHRGDQVQPVRHGLHRPGGGFASRCPVPAAAALAGLPPAAAGRGLAGHQPGLGATPRPR